MKLPFVKKINLFKEQEDIIDRNSIKQLFDCINIKVLFLI